MGSPLLQIRDLKVYYATRSGPVRAVDDMSLTVDKKEIFGIVGESGCGKSTLAAAIMGLVKPPGYIEGGEIIFKETNLLDLDAESLRTIRGREISLIPQSSMNALQPVIKTGGQIADAITTHQKVPSKKLNDEIIALLRTVGLQSGVVKMYSHELSGGMKQRVTIAMAIALKPSLIIADEPTTALDVVVQRAILEAMKDLSDRLGSSIILITHDISVQAEIVDRLAVIYAGKVMEISDIHSIFSNPIHPYTRGLISSVPTIKERRHLKGIPGIPPNLINPPTGCRFHPRCPSVMEICKHKAPVLQEVEAKRWVACHLYK